MILTQSKSRHTHAKKTLHWITCLLLAHHSHATKCLSFKDVSVFLYDWKSAFSHITNIIYTVFGEEWTNARVYRTVVQRVGEKFEILWDVDDERSVFGSDHLCIEDVHGHQTVMLQLSAYLLEFRVNCAS